MDVRQIDINRFDYELPESRIASHPLAQRDACRLLVRSADGVVRHERFDALCAELPAGALLVRNDTRVINARLRFCKSTGAWIEVFLLEPVSPSDYALMFQSQGECVWDALVGNLKRWKVRQDGSSDVLTLGPLRAERVSSPASGSGLVRVRLCWEPRDLSFADVLERVGRIPIPPYLNRDSEQSDLLDYQTVYSHIRGSVAAPTAGLHFTPELFERLRCERGIEVCDVTLHVGAGTFKPVKAEVIGGHEMHTETFSVSSALVRKLSSAVRSGRCVVAVGTTTVRTLESLPLLAWNLMRGLPAYVGQWDAYAPEAAEIDTAAALDRLADFIDARGGSMVSSTAVMIAPGFRWRITSGLVTNFHQPRSTLLLLVSSFLGRNGRAEDVYDESWRRLYAEALALDYRFLSYGDAMLLW